tara:strand:- start:41 stop:331 length:291 start_codon:yes stop_codon:yes gene_type:complete
MSIVHKPRFNVGIVKKPPKVRTDARKIVHWTTTEIENLVELRSIGLSHKECGKLLNRSAAACVGAVKSNLLNPRISKKRKDLENDAQRKNSSIAAN